MRVVARIVFTILQIIPFLSANALDGRSIDMRHVACYSKESLGKLLSAKKEDNAGDIVKLMNGKCSVVENSEYLYIEETPDKYKIHVFFGENKIDMFVSDDFAIK